MGKNRKIQYTKIILKNATAILWHTGTICVSDGRISEADEQKLVERERKQKYLTTQSTTNMSKKGNPYSIKIKATASLQNTYNYTYRTVTSIQRYIFRKFCLYLCSKWTRPVWFILWKTFKHIAYLFLVNLLHRQEKNN